MPLVIPNALEVEILQAIVTPDLTVRLYSNNLIPGPTNVAGNFTEVVGGGYVTKPLTFGTWEFVANNPSYAVSNPLFPLIWTFTGVVNAPGTVYGYYITRNLDGLLMWAERFPAALLPFSPIAGSMVQLTPRLTGNSVY
jgi:hypothetical protein